MCGITGILSKDSRSDILERVKRMNLSIAHRGMDSEGVLEVMMNRICIGHRRLSIIDLATVGFVQLFVMNKQKIIIGENIQTMISWLKNINAKRIFLLTGKNSFELSGSKSYLQPILDQYPYVLYSDFGENPKIEDVYKGVEIINKEKCDCCITVGGGSVLDMGKLICYLKEETTNNPKLIEQNKLKKVNRRIPICAIPTTAGSGAESTHFSVVYINGKKYSLAHETILPDFVNLNPRLSFTMPPYLKAVTGLDALAHGIESYWSKNATKQSREYSTLAIELVWNNLKKSVLKNDFESHTKVVIGSNYAGRAINIAKTTAPHAFSYYFTSKHNINHGHAVAFTLGNVFQYNYDKAMNSNNEIQQIFHNLNNLLHIKNGIPKTIIEDFILSLNIELDYTKLGIEINKELPAIKKQVNKERLKNNPFLIPENDYNKLTLHH